MIEELLWVVRLVRMIFSAGGYSKRVQITSDLHPFFSAEREGFEPPEPLSSTVFKTAAIDHSAISPWSILPRLRPIRKGG